MPSAFKSLWSKQDGDVPFLQKGLGTPDKIMNEECASGVFVFNL